MGCCLSVFISGEASIVCIQRGELLQDHVQRNRCIFESYVVFGFELCYNIYYIQDDMIWLLTTAYTII